MQRSRPGKIFKIKLFGSDRLTEKISGILDKAQRKFSVQRSISFFDINIASSLGAVRYGFKDLFYL
jgi:hypothetical protein